VKENDAPLEIHRNGSEACVQASKSVKCPRNRHASSSFLPKSDKQNAANDYRLDNIKSISLKRQA
jgi:hypothetical protein